MKVFISCDHGGFNLKNKIVEHLKIEGYDVTDFGPRTLDTKDDFALYVEPVATSVAKDTSSKGLVLCRNGVGVSIAANKIKGIRCALSFAKKHAISSRNDDDSNVLALPSDYISDQEAMEIVDTWLATPFSGEERFIRRIQEVSSLESKN